MSVMTPHTPPPWNYAKAFSSVVGVPIVSQNGQRVGNTAMPNMPDDMLPERDEFKQRAVANAGFICKAVNNHDALVNALQNARRYIDSVIVNTPDKKKKRNFGECLQIIDDALRGVGGSTS